MSSTDIAVIERGNFLALSSSNTEVQEIIQANLGGQAIDEFDLPRAKMPSGGALRWEAPTVDGTEPVDELTGIVVATKQARAYWPGQFKGSQPPQCSSRDGVVGVGDPGGDCETCPFAQFGSAEDGRGQACKQMAQWLLLPANSYLPIVVTLPPTSLKAAKQYMLRLAGAGILHSKVVTAIALEKDSNPDGVDYARAKPRLAGTLDDEAAAAAAELAQVLKPIFAKVAIDDERTNGSKTSKGGD